MIPSVQMIEADRKKSDYELAADVRRHLGLVLSQKQEHYSTTDRVIRQQYEIASDRFFSRIPKKDIETCDYIAAGNHVNRFMVICLIDSIEQMLPTLPR